MALVLASGSPRRRELLAAAGFAFEIDPSNEEENAGALPPGELVVTLARMKAQSVFARRPGDVVVGADTVVAVGDEILGKPADEADGRRMLRRLSGARHTVFTGVAVCSANRSEAFCARTDVFFRPLDDAHIASYAATGEPLDKAGAYGIQGRGALLVERIDGDYYNVMGLPVAELAQRLRLGYGVLPRWMADECQ